MTDTTSDPDETNSDPDETNSDPDGDTVEGDTSLGHADRQHAPRYAPIETVGELTPEGFERFMRHDATTLELRHAGETKLVIQDTGKPDITRPSMHRLGGGTKRLEWSVDTVVSNPVHGMSPAEDPRWNDGDDGGEDTNDGEGNDDGGPDGDDTDRTDDADTDGELDGDTDDGDGKMTFSLSDGPGD